ncbi:MAG TPA: prenyltransferase/squalene oxidase repeat-containing protein [Acidimicrobiales bacterium]|nr:prenyltransferase/squalene oxidase repeat-containing protein [Acidimicrobiales bacterium]
MTSSSCSIAPPRGPTGGPAGLDLAAARRYVLGRRTVAGGYCFYRVPAWGVEEPNAPDTLAALESLRLLRTPPQGAAATAQWLRGLQSADGGYPTRVIGWAALRGLDVLGARPRASAQRWLAAWAATVGGPFVDGGWAAAVGVPSADGEWAAAVGDGEWAAAVGDAMRLVELHRVAAVPLAPQALARIAGLLGAGRGPASSAAPASADLATAALARRLAGSAGVATDDAATIGVLRGCEDAALGFRLRADAAATSVGALLGGLWLARATATPVRYPEAVAERLASLQRADGGLGSRDRAISTLHATWLGLLAARLLAQSQRMRHA